MGFLSKFKKEKAEKQVDKASDLLYQQQFADVLGEQVNAASGLKKVQETKVSKGKSLVDDIPEVDVNIAKYDTDYQDKLKEMEKEAKKLQKENKELFNKTR